MTSKARAMMDALMGPDRDSAREENKDKFKEPTVCRSFLLGFCPLDPRNLGDRRNIDACKKAHSEIMKGQFLSHPDYDKLKLQFESEAIPIFEWTVSQCAKRVESEKNRIREDLGNRQPPLSAEAVTEIGFIRRAQRVRMKEAEALDDDKYQERIKLMRESEELAKEAEAFQEKEVKKAKQNATQEEVCHDCGSTYLGSAGHAAHLEFKVHTCYVEIRSRLAAMKERAEKARAEKSRAPPAEPEGKAKEGGEGEGGEGKSSRRPEKDKDSGRDKDKGDKDEQRSRSRGKADKDKDKGHKDKGDKGKDKDKGDKDKGDKGRDKDKGDKDEQRSRSRGKADKDKDKGHKDKGDKGRDKDKGDKGRDRGRSRSRSKDSLGRDKGRGKAVKDKDRGRTRDSRSRGRRRR